MRTKTNKMPRGCIEAGETDCISADKSTKAASDESASTFPSIPPSYHLSRDWSHSGERNIKRNTCTNNYQGRPRTPLVATDRSRNASIGPLQVSTTRLVVSLLPKYQGLTKREVLQLQRFNAFSRKKRLAEHRQRHVLAKRNVRDPPQCKSMCLAGADAQFPSKRRRTVSLNC